MKTIYNIYESILDDIETTMTNGTNAIIIDMIFDKDLNRRCKGFEQLLSMVESYHPKEHKTTAKMKNSDSYFVEFYWPIKVEDGELTNKILDHIIYIQVFKQTLFSYKTAGISAAEDWNGKINVVMTTWKYAQQNLNPKAKNTKLYEVPEELNGLFEQIQMEAEKRRSI